MKKENLLLTLLKEEYDRLYEMEQSDDGIDYEMVGFQIGGSPNADLIESLDDVIKQYDPSFLNMKERESKKKQDMIDELLDIEMTFGKFKGKLLSEVDTDYMQWAVKNVRDEDKKELVTTMFNLIKLGHYRSNSYLDECDFEDSWHGCGLF